MYKKENLSPCIYLVCNFFLMTLLACSPSVKAQYYPEPPRIRPDQEPRLLKSYSKNPGNNEKIALLIDLSNLYYNKPYKLKQDISRSLFYAEEAKKLSLARNNQKSFNKAQLRIATALLAQNNFKAAEAILPTLDDSCRLNLLLQFCFMDGVNSIDPHLPGKVKGIMYVDRARALATKLNDKEAELLTRRYRAEAHLSRGKFKEAEHELQQLLKTYNAIGYKRLHYVFLDLSMLNDQTGNYDKALDYALKAANVMAATKDTLAAGDIFMVLGTQFRRESEWEKSIEMYKASAKNYRINAGLATVIYAESQIADVYTGQHQYQKAIDYLQSAIKHIPEGNEVSRQTIISSLADCYLKLKMYNESEHYFLKEFHINKSTDPNSEATYHRIAFFYVESKKYNKAIPYLHEALKHETASTAISTKGHLQFMLFLADSAAGNYRSAISHLRQNKLYDDSALQVGKTAATQNLIIQYETNKKNQRIKILEQNDQIQNSRLKQANLITKITIGGLLLFIAAGIIFYRQFRQRQLAAKIISRKNVQMERLLSEKEWLLKEVHHRVKNNLHTVVSLLEIQAEFLKDDALEAIENSQHRIFAMSLIHQKLYMAEDVKSINMAEYLPELVTYLKESFADQRNITFELNIQPIQLGVSQAMPLGLITNEAVTNAIKYAFPAQQTGKITVSLEKDKENVILFIADDGVGFDRDTEFQRESSLGLKLMNGLSGDINGTLTFFGKKGTHIQIVFPLDPTDGDEKELPIIKREGRNES